MMRAMRSPTVLALLLSGCATAGSSVEVHGKDVDVMVLAGRWEGTYAGIESGRRGTVTFDLASGFRIAEGQVMMSALDDPAKAVPLKVKFVDVGGGAISGKIDPYPEPKCACTVETEFKGRFAGNTLDGTFETRPVGKEVIQRGTWSAKRVP